MADSEKNLTRAGHFFMSSLWIQGQMVDLIILSKHPRIRKRFIERKKRVPTIMSKERMIYWQKDFAEVSKEFVSIFNDLLTDDARKDIDTIYYLRNAIAHSHISFALDYLLYRPKGARKKVRDIIRSLGVTKRPSAASPIVFKLSFGDDAKYEKTFEVVTRTDQTHMKAVADWLKIPHSRIR